MTPSTTSVTNKPRAQVYVTEDVLTAARRRIATLFDAFPNLIVSVSGGKDSTVLAHLALAEARRRDRKLGIFFLDEEVVYQSTVEQIDYLMHLDPAHTIPLWLQVEFHLTNATSLIEGQLICWEAGKHKLWMRPKRRDSIQHPPWPRESETIRDRNKGFGFYDALDNFQHAHRDTAFLVGVRAVESMNRFRAVAKHPGHQDLYWTTAQPHGCVSAYPLYDWNFHDIWKYIYDEGLRYSRIYDYLWRQGAPLNEIRVSSLIHEHSFKSLVSLPAFEPKTYDRLVRRIGGITIGHLYGKDAKLLRARTLPKGYTSWRVYRDFLLATYPDESKRPIFVRRFARYLDNEYVARQECRQLLLNDYENNVTVDNRPDPREQAIEKWRNLL